MSDEYNMPTIGLFGRRCLIPNGYDKRPFVYRIVNSGIVSNGWCEPPLTYQSEHNVILHDHSEPILIVVCDTLIDENSKLIRVALKDVELMPEMKEQPERKHGHWIPIKEPTGVEAFGVKEMAVQSVRCSACNTKDDVSFSVYEYCPRCGAIMDGEVKHED